MIGKKVRLERIINRNTGRTVIIPMDHGITLGPILGLENMSETIDKMVEGGANAIIVHKGLVISSHRSAGKDVGLIIHLSASTKLNPDSNDKVIVTSVEQAIKLGADGVSVHLNLGALTESKMIKDVGKISDICMKWGMPLLAMIYTRGSKVQNEFDPKFIKHAARVGAELGADIVKVNYTGSVESFKEIVKGCPVPIVIAGGEKLETEEDLFLMVEGAMKAGASGLSIGRNTFQHKYPIKIVKIIGKMVHQNISAKEALKLLEKKNEKDLD
ncbi:MAG: 2-amino-3,7-dideoxy-D-threo-hept-6-ulosonate synthase [bacterium]